MPSWLLPAVWEDKPSGLDQQPAHLFNIPGTQGEDRIAGLSPAAHQLRRFFKALGIIDLGASALGDGVSQHGGADIAGIGLTGSVDIQKHKAVHLVKAFDEVLKQGLGPGIGVGLEYAVQPPVGQLPGRSQRGLDFGGMMGIIVENVGAAVVAGLFKAAVGSGKAGKDMGGLLQRDAGMIGHRHGSAGVQHVVPAHDLQLDLRRRLTIVQQGEGIASMVLAEGHSAPGSALLEAEGFAGAGSLGQHPQHPGVVRIAQGEAAGRRQLDKPGKGRFNGLNILEIIEMIGVDIENYGQGGEEAQKAILVFAGLRHKEILPAHLGRASDQGKGAAQVDGGMLPGQLQDGSDHRGCRGLSMGAGYADDFLIGLHKLPQQGAALHNGDPQLVSHCDLRIAVGDGGGAHDKARPLDKLRLMPHGAGDSDGPKLAQGFRLLLVGAGYLVAGFRQHQRQAAHGNPADSGEVDDLLFEIFYMHQA